MADTKPNAQTTTPGPNAGAVDALLEELLRLRWARLDTVEADVLGMLFAERDRHWTMGWHPGTGNLVTLVWELDSWGEKPTWHLYLNGDLILKERDGEHAKRSERLQALLESRRLPIVNQRELLESLQDYRLTEETRRQRLQALIHLFSQRPDIWDHLKDGLFAILKDGLEPDAPWPLLDTQKIHHLHCKNMLVAMFRLLLSHGFLRPVEDRIHLNTALEDLQRHYLDAPNRLTAFYRPACEQAHAQFRQMILDGNWRIRLFNEAAMARTQTHETAQAAFNG